MEENLFTPSAIKFFGREFKGLSVNRSIDDEGNLEKPLDPARIPPTDVQKDLPYKQHPGRLERALRKVAWDEATEKTNYARFARIYSFSYEGQYYELPRPVLFLVYGPGTKVDDKVDKGFTIEQVGLAAKDWRFASDIRMWEVDDKAMSMCIDIESGTIKQILLEPMFELDEDMAFRGAAASRGAAVTRGAAVGRGAASSRGAAAVRGAAISREPHRNR
ncbi:MAG: hypothetical protein O7A66_03990 [Alphaproteobacteria bacterium]|nr:hypothetical protein [Alphaproteobacteria bacterium]